jgi:hypothetical protein
MKTPSLALRVRLSHGERKRIAGFPGSIPRRRNRLVEKNRFMERSSFSLWEKVRMRAQRWRSETAGGGGK